MSRTFIIVLPRDESQPALWGEWHEGEAGLKMTGQGLDLSASPSWPPSADHRLIVVVPGEDVKSHIVSLPAKSLSQARRAAPFATEDYLGVDPGDLHFAVEESVPVRPRLVFNVDNGLMQDWLGSLADNGLMATHMVADYTLLPVREAEAVCVNYKDMTLVRLHDGSGFTVETELADSILQDSPVFAGVPAEGTIVATDEDYLNLLADGARAGSLPSLLQGPYARRAPWLPDWRALQRTAALVALVMISGLLSLAVDGWRYDRAAEAAYAESERVLQEAFPDIRRIVNPRAQLKAEMDKVRGNGPSSFLSLTAQFYAGLQEVSGVKVEALRFDDSKSQLSADLSYQEFSDLERIKASLTAQGVRLKEGSSRQEGQRIFGDVELEAGR